MSTTKRIDACTIPVGPSHADVLRTQTRLVLEFNHHYYEDLSDLSPEAQYALSVIYRDAFAVLDTVGWRRPADPPATLDVPLTFGHVDHLRHRRFDLGATNLDRLPPDNGPISAECLAAITVDRLAAGALDQIIGTAEMVLAAKARAA
jgi:hypothetical protein